MDNINDNLKNLENRLTEEGLLNDKKEISLNNEKTDEREYLGDYKLPSTIDGYRFLTNDNLPFTGKLYPESWRFGYRCPTSMEVANFSTINEEDQPAIIVAVEDLIKKCFVIVDSNKNNEVSSAQINDGDRLFFFLKLREFYLHDKPIQYIVMNQTHNEPVTVSLLGDLLQYPELNEKLLSCFDGRTFTIPVENQEEPIRFLIPTLEISSRIFKYMIKSYKEVQKENNDKIKNVDSFDKQFLLIAPYLYINGNETIEALKQKFKLIQKNDGLLNAYITIINRLKLKGCEHHRTDAEIVHLYHGKRCNGGMEWENPKWAYNRNLLIERKDILVRNKNKEWGKL